MKINAELINELRKKTGIGIAACKEALLATDGNVENAITWIRLNTKEKPERLARPTGEGTIAVQVDLTTNEAAFATVLCETDFAARNSLFKDLANQLATLQLKSKSSEPINASDLIANATNAIKENIKLGECEKFELAGTGRIGSYLHSNGKLAVLVGVNCKKPESVENADFNALLKDLAMHIAGSSSPPLGVGRSCVPSELVEKEKAFIATQLETDASFSKKPANIQQKIVEGKMGKFYKETTLLEQPFVKDETKTVDQIVKEVSKKLGDELSVAWFVRQGLDNS